MILLDPKIWLAALLWTGAASGLGYWKGGKDNEARHTRQALKDEKQARETETELARMNNRATTIYLDRVASQQRKANALPKITLPADCAVPADIGGLLNDAQQHLPADAGTGTDAGAATPVADSTCSAELEIAKRNYAEVCLPNADQLRELQQRWELTRKALMSH